MVEATTAYKSQESHTAKPPRGYCAPISRAIPSQSRCFEHLLGRASVGNGHAHSEENKPNQPKTEDDGEEELVYVRLETSGSSLANLSTRAINERLLLGVFDQLFNTDHSSQQQLRDVRAQILVEDGGGGGVAASKCRPALERLVCRLVYPSCHFRRSDVSALVRPPCREDCFLLRDLFCANLNWSQFSQQLERAFNSTLMDAIEWPLQLEPPLPPPPPAGMESISRKGSGPDQRPRLRREVSSNQVASGKSEHFKVPPIHFYWPHEHSLKHCHRLPPLRPVNLSPEQQQRQQQLSEWRRRRRRGTTSENLVGSQSSPSPSPSTLANLSAAIEISNRTGGRRGGRNVARVWPVCSDAHLTAAAATKWTRPSWAQTNGRGSATENCLTSQDGIDYVGRENRTQAGLGCQPWSSQTPHKHTR